MSDELNTIEPFGRARALLLALAVFCGHLLLMSGHLMSPDGELLYRTAESIALRGRLAVLPIEYDPQLGQLLVPAEQTFATVMGRNGEFHVQYLPLQPVLSAPLIWIAEATSGIFAESFAATLPNTAAHPVTDSVSSWRRGVVVMFFNPAVAALTALVLLRLAMLLTGGNRRAAVAAVLLWAFTTVAWPHSRTYFTEPLAGLLALLSIERMLTWLMTPDGETTDRRRLVLMVQMGAAMAGAIWTRMDSPLIAFGTGLTMAGTAEWLRRRGARPGNFAWRDYLVSGGIIVGSFLLLVLFNYWRFAGNAMLLGGGYADQSEGVKFATDPLVGLHGLLASPGKGMFWFSPGLVLGIWGWLRAPREKRWMAAAVLLSWVPFTLAMMTWQNWDGGWCWGPRHIVQIHAPLMLGAAFLVAEGLTALRRVAIAVIAAAGVFVQGFGALQSPMDFYLEMFRTSDDGLYFNLAYRPMEVQDATRNFLVYARDSETGEQSARPVSPMLLPAPMVESLYVPQHTQWAGYLLMLQEGYCDWWLLARILPGGEAGSGADSGNTG